MTNPATILAIDDDAAVRESIIAYLEDSGFRVIGAKNGEEGLADFQSKRPDLVLTDLQMPGVKGLEVLEKINTLAPEIPVIVISGAGGMDDAIKALRLGAWDYLTKPITDLAVLEHSVCKCLERARLVEENKRYRHELEKTNSELSNNLRILREDQEAGRNIQFQLLPEQKMIRKGYSFSHLVIPSLYLSGDFVDYFDIDEQHTGFYLADVSGHGASSAFVTVFLKSNISTILMRYRSQGEETILRPNELMTRVSSELYNMKLGKYLTMVYGVINHTTHQLTYSVGGHLPNPILKSTHTAFLPGRGFPIGIFAHPTYDVHQVNLEESSSIALFSDGVFDVMHDHSIAAKEQSLLKMVASVPTKVQAYLDELKISDKNALPDDFTLLLIERQNA